MGTHSRLMCIQYAIMTIYRHIRETRRCFASLHRMQISLHRLGLTCGGLSSQFNTLTAKECPFIIYFNMSASPFHDGEKFVQEKYRVRAEAEGLGNAMLRSAMTEQHRVFFDSLTTVYVSSVTVNSGVPRVWSSIAAGPTGHIRCLDYTTISIRRSSFLDTDPINLSVGSTLGLLGIELHTRRRNRVNGIITASGQDQIRIQVQQAFGNCPKYIQTRQVVPLDRRVQSSLVVSQSHGQLGPEDVSMIRRADTFFLGTATPGAGHTSPAENSQGCDVSHRGGACGFVQVSETTSPAGEVLYQLKWADYAGNNMFNSLGNIQVNPIAGMLFIDWLTGDTLQVTGAARVNFQDDSLPGGERTVEVDVHSFVRTTGALQLAAPALLIEASPYNPSAEDLLMVKCVDIRDEGEDVKSFEFSLPNKLAKQFASTPLLAGQYASFDFPVSRGPPLTRTWTISSDPHYVATNQGFAITVKRVGVVTSFLHEDFEVGQKLPLRAIAGDFTPNFETIRATTPSGVLLVAGGIGITPLKAMLPGLLACGIAVTLLYSVRKLSEVLFASEIVELFAQYAGRTGVKSQFVVTVTGDSTGRDYVLQTSASYDVLRGRVSGDMIQQLCPRYNDMMVYMCGPVPFMNRVSEVLVQDLQFANPDRIHSESFAF